MIGWLCDPLSGWVVGVGWFVGWVSGFVVSWMGG